METATNSSADARRGRYEEIPTTATNHAMFVKFNLLYTATTSATTSVSMALGSKEVTFIATHGTLTTAVLPRRSTMSSPIHGGKLFSSAGCTAAWSLTPTTEQ